MSSTLGQIQHQFAAWAAATAGSASPKCRFSTADGIGILEAIGFKPAYGKPERLPHPAAFDKAHRRWREKAIREAKRRRIAISHGVAAKLINVYLKSRFICGGHADHPKVAALHPPIDSILLKELARLNCGKLGPVWRTAAKIGWSNFSSKQYELVASCIRSVQHPWPAWLVEKHWNPTA